MTSVNLPGSRPAVAPSLTNTYPSSPYSTPLSLSNSGNQVKPNVIQRILPPNSIVRSSMQNGEIIRRPVNAGEIRSRNNVAQSDPLVMPGEFPAEFIQSQIVRDINPLRSDRLPTRNGINSREIKESGQVYSPSKSSYQSKQKIVTKQYEVTKNGVSGLLPMGHKAVSPQATVFVQNYEEIKQSPRITLPYNRSVQRAPIKLDVIPENNDTSMISDETARFLDEPPATPRRTEKGVAYSYTGYNNETGNRNTSMPVITVTPPIDSGIRKGNRAPYVQSINSIGDNYVNSSYTPVIIDRGLSEVTESAPVGVFSGIEYGHGIIKNRQPKAS